ncbi:MAG: hypothetical protein ACK5NF_03020 [Bacilli bacterium]
MIRLYILIHSYRYNIERKVRDKFDDAIIKYDAWFLVFLAVLMALAFSIAAALTIWCVVYKGKKFTYRWKWSLRGVSVKAECK